MIIEGATQSGPDSIDDAIRIRQVAMRPLFGHLVKTCVTEAIGFPVINEVENPPDGRVYYNFVNYPMRDWSRFRTSTCGFLIVPPAPMLKSVSE